jgi:translation initiation factor IF-1
MSGRFTKLNTQGGKGFKKQKKGGTSYRAQAAKNGATEMLDLITARHNGFVKMSAEERAEAEKALLEIQVGRVVRKFGGARFEVFCQDGVVRNCALRGLLRRKGQCFVDIDSIVTVSLSEPLEEMDSSDDEGAFGKGKSDTYKSKSNQGWIAGIFDADAVKELRKTRITPRLFVVRDAAGEEVDEDEFFDRSAAASDEGAAAAGGGKKKRADDAEDDIVFNIDDL